MSATARERILSIVGATVPPAAYGLPQRFTRAPAQSRLDDMIGACRVYELTQADEREVPLTWGGSTRLWVADAEVRLRYEAAQGHALEDLRRVAHADARAVHKALTTPSAWAGDVDSLIAGTITDDDVQGVQAAPVALVVSIPVTYQFFA